MLEVNCLKVKLHLHPWATLTVSVVPVHRPTCHQVAKTLLEFGANASAMDSNGAFPDEVVGEGCSPSIDDASVRELTEIVVGHRTRGHGSDGEEGAGSGRRAETTLRSGVIR